MAIQNINSVTRVQSTPAKPAAPSNPLGVEWVTAPASNSGIQVDWMQAPQPIPSQNPNPGPQPKPVPIKIGLEPEHLRIGTPLITQVGNWIADKVGLGSIGGGSSGGGMAPGLDPSLGPVDPGLGGGFAGDPMIGDPSLGGSLPSDPTVVEPGMGDPGLATDFSGGTMGGVGGGASSVFSRLGEAVNAGFQAAKGALKRNFIFAGITSAISNGISYFTGKATGKQAVSGFVADTGAYTAIGSASTFAGAALGTLIPIPFVGTAIGIAAGMGLGYLYEKFIRKDLVSKVEGVVDGLSRATGKNAVATGKTALDKLAL
jgi:hypothetical protein